MSEKRSSFADRMTPFLVVIVVALAFITGSLWQKVNSLTSGNLAANNNAADAAPQVAYAQMSEDEAKNFTQVSSFTIENNKLKLGEGELVRGNLDTAEVYLIEYSDLECPFCAVFHETAKKVFDEYGDRIAWVYRHFPLDSIHPNARPAAIGSECVFKLGGNESFWKFTDEIFANQQTAFTKLGDIVANSGVSKSEYEACVTSNSTAQAVEDDYQKGLDAGVTGTPGNFIMNKDGEVWTVYGAVPEAELRNAIEEALN